MNLQQAIFLGGLLHFVILIASALVPRVLDWKTALSPLNAMIRRLFWVYGAFIVLVIIAFGTLSIFLAGDLASRSLLARSVCGFMASFWAARLLVQFFVFDMTAYLRTPLLKAGYHALTVVFATLTVIYCIAAFGAE